MSLSRLDGIAPGRFGVFAGPLNAQPSSIQRGFARQMEQFGYGLGFTVFTVNLMYSAQGRYKTSHYAISTGIMALGMMLPGFVSGWLQQSVGYTTFFIIVCVMTIPGMLTIPFLPNIRQDIATGKRVDTE